MTENMTKKQGFFQILKENKVSFLINLFLVLLVTFSFLYLFDLVPSEFKTLIGRNPTAEEKPQNAVGELPLTIKIPKIGTDVAVYNPTSTSTQVLDEHLLQGAVRYPGSGLPGGKGNTLILGHSTGFRIVNNQAFKAFNGLKDLVAGDSITVYSDAHAYTYEVVTVRMEKASEVRVILNTKEQMLTLATCNTFAGKEDRYVVEAKLVKTEKLVQQ